MVGGGNGKSKNMGCPLWCEGGGRIKVTETIPITLTEEKEEVAQRVAMF